MPLYVSARSGRGFKTFISFARGDIKEIPENNNKETNSYLMQRYHPARSGKRLITFSFFYKEIYNRKSKIFNNKTNDSNTRLRASITTS